jgi:hypothetical protein
MRLVIVSNMTNQLIHRNPDTGAIWVDPNKSSGFGFPRFSIT